MFNLKFSMDNAAFEESPGEEMARILRSIAAKVSDLKHGEDHGGKIYDANGNAIGSWSVETDED